ncbi:hypothetical protein ES703_74978 [subsurface metagenome]
MKPRLLLDFADFPVLEHSSVRTMVARVCSDLEVIEEEPRRTRELEAADINVITGIVAAVAAVIGLFLPILRSRKNHPDKNRQNLRITISRVETQLSIRLPEGVKQELEEKLVTEVRPLLIQFQIANYLYQLTVHEGEDVTMIRGRIK